MDAKLKGQPYDAKAFDTRVRGAVAETVQKQIETGLDVITDGEQSKNSFSGYVSERLGGFQRETQARRSPRLDSPEGRMFPEYYEQYVKRRPAVGPSGGLVCVGPITYTGQEA